MTDLRNIRRSIPVSQLPKPSSETVNKEHKAEVKITRENSLTDEHAENLPTNTLSDMKTDTSIIKTRIQQQFESQDRVEFRHQNDIPRTEIDAKPDKSQLSPTIDVMIQMALSIQQSEGSKDGKAAGQILTALSVFEKTLQEIQSENLDQMLDILTKADASKDSDWLKSLATVIQLMQKTFGTLNRDSYHMLENLLSSFGFNQAEAETILQGLMAIFNQQAGQDKIKADLVKLRYFGGLTAKQASKVLDISNSTADEYWTYARAWLRLEINKGDESTIG